MMGREPSGRFRATYAKAVEKFAGDPPADVVDLCGGRYGYCVLGRTETLRMMAEDRHKGVNRSYCEMNAEVGPMRWDVDMKINSSMTNDEIVDFANRVGCAAIRRCFPDQTLKDRTMIVMVPTKATDAGPQLLTKTLRYEVCPQCETLLNDDPITTRLVCDKCHLAYDPETLKCTHAQSDDKASWAPVAGERSELEVRTITKHKIGIHLVCRNKPFEGPQEAAQFDQDPTVGPFVDASMAEEINDLAITLAQQEYSSDPRFGADFPWEDALDDEPYRPRGSLRMPGFGKMSRCDVCSAKKALMKFCWACKRTGKVFDERRYAVIAAVSILTGERVEVPFDTSSTVEGRLATIMGTSVRAPEGCHPTEGYQPPSGIPRIPRDEAHATSALNCDRPLPPPRSEQRRAVERKGVKAGKESARGQDVPESVRKLIETIIHKNWPERYSKLIVRRAFHLGGDATKPVIVHVDGEGSRFCHHKKDDHSRTSAAIWFQIKLLTAGAAVQQRCWSPHAYAGVSCKKWTGTKAHGLTSEQTLSLFPHWRAPPIRDVAPRKPASRSMKVPREVQTLTQRTMDMMRKAAQARKTSAGVAHVPVPSAWLNVVCKDKTQPAAYKAMKDHLDVSMGTSSAPAPAPTAKKRKKSDQGQLEGAKADSVLRSFMDMD